MRKARSTKERARLFDLRHGVCYLCSGKIQVGEAWEIEHEIALEISGDDTDANLQLAHAKCHKAKTAIDAGLIARAKRREAKHIGAHAGSSHPMPGSKASGLRKRMNGIVERRP